MPASAVVCGRCSWLLPPDLWNREGSTRCPGCGASVRVLAFPAIEQARRGEAPQPVQSEMEAACFYHPDSRAATVCDECGRFLCQLCDLDTEGRHLCPTCFASGVQTRKLDSFERRRTMYDSMALALATLPALLFWPAVLTAPATLVYVAIRWKKPLSLAPRTRIRYVLAVLFAVAEIAFVVFIVLLILNAGRPIRAR